MDPGHRGGWRWGLLLAAAALRTRRDDRVFLLLGQQLCCHLRLGGMRHTAYILAVVAPVAIARAVQIDQLLAAAPAAIHQCSKRRCRAGVGSAGNAVAVVIVARIANVIAVVVGLVVVGHSRAVVGAVGYAVVVVIRVTKGIKEVRLSHDHWVQAVAFSPDGRSLVTGSTDKTARVWDVITGMEQARLAHAEGVTAVVFSPDGMQLATGSWDRTVRVWEISTGTEQARLSHQAPVFAVAYSPDGRHVVTGRGIHLNRDSLSSIQ